jgi:hypothetical protein
MNIYQIVINTVAGLADITESAGFINIKESSTTNAPSLSIPKAGVVAARRLVAGEKRQVWTVTLPTPANSTTYTISVSGKSTVTGVSKTFTASYTTAVSGTTQAQLAAGLATGLTTNESPFTITNNTSTLVIEAKSGTPSISVAANFLNGTSPAAVNTTAGLSGITGGANVVISSSGALSGGTNLQAELPQGAAFYASNQSGSVSLTGYIAQLQSATAATVVPSPSGALTPYNFATSTAGSTGMFIIDNTGTSIENTYAYAALPGVNLTGATRYVVYEIDAIASSDAGNGARPDVIESKYIVYANAGDPDTWSGTGFDATLATKCGLSNF